VPDYTINPAVVTDMPPAHDLLKNGDHLFYLDGDNLVEVIKINGVLFEEKMSRQSGINTPPEMTARSYLAYGKAGAMSTDTDYELFTLNGADNGMGVTMIRDGILTGISASLDNTLTSPGSTTGYLDIYVYLKGVQQVSTKLEVVNTGPTPNEWYNVFSTPIPFEAKDTIGCHAIKRKVGTGSGGSVDDLAVLVEIMT
tara:strand:- start:659 stop:1252 length:594 start_codon:yes stop_codon:yes gene_type:complete